MILVIQSSFAREYHTRATLRDSSPNWLHVACDYTHIRAVERLALLLTRTAVLIRTADLKHSWISNTNFNFSNNLHNFASMLVDFDELSKKPTLTKAEKIRSICLILTVASSSLNYLTSSTSALLTEPEHAAQKTRRKKKK